MHATYRSGKIALPLLSVPQSFRQGHLEGVDGQVDSDSEKLQLSTEVEAEAHDVCEERTIDVRKNGDALASHVLTVRIIEDE